MSYEFSATENQTIQRTAGRSVVYGYASVALGALGTLGGLAALVVVGGAAGAVGIGIAVALLPNLIAGFWYVRAGESLKGVVETQGHDIALMMVAMDRIAAAFKLEGIASIIGMVAGFIIGFAMVAAQ